MGKNEQELFRCKGGNGEDIRILRKAGKDLIQVGRKTAELPPVGYADPVSARTEMAEVLVKPCPAHVVYDTLGAGMARPMILEMVEKSSDADKAKLLTFLSTLEREQKRSQEAWDRHNREADTHRDALEALDLDRESLAGQVEQYGRALRGERDKANARWREALNRRNEAEAEAKQAARQRDKARAEADEAKQALKLVYEEMKAQQEQQPQEDQEPTSPDGASGETQTVAALAARVQELEQRLSETKH